MEVIFQIGTRRYGWNRSRKNLAKRTDEYVKDFRNELDTSGEYLVILLALGICHTQLHTTLFPRDGWQRVRMIPEFSLKQAISAVLDLR